MKCPISRSILPALLIPRSYELASARNRGPADLLYKHDIRRLRSLSAPNNTPPVTPLRK